MRPRQSTVEHLFRTVPSLFYRMQAATVVCGERHDTAPKTAEFSP